MWRSKAFCIFCQASLPPAKIILPRRVKIVQLSAGLHHTLMLSEDGEVFGFGSNSHGQLGQVRFQDLALLESYIIHSNALCSICQWMDSRKQDIEMYF